MCTLHPWLRFASPVSSSIYYPVMLTLAKDLNTSLTEYQLDYHNVLGTPHRFLALHG